MSEEKLAVVLLSLGLLIILGVHIATLYGWIKDNYLLILFVDFSFILILIFWRTADYLRYRELKKLRRNCEKLELELADRSQESRILQFIRELVESFNEKQSLEIILQRLGEWLKHNFPKDCVFLEVIVPEVDFSFQYSTGERKAEKIFVTVRGEVMEKKQAKLINNLSSFPQFSSLSSQFSSLLAVPLLKGDRCLGMLGVITRESYHFSGRELDFLTSLALHAGMIIENAELLEKTKLLSITDDLTQVFNRRHFQKKLAEELEEARKNSLPLSLILGDVDDFKFYNDHNGHIAGDRVLREIAQVLKNNTKRRDTVARFGGEEFVIILPQTTHSAALKLADNLRRKVAEINFPEEKAMPQGDVTITFGVSTFPEDGEDAEQLIKAADERLYQGKNRGKNCVVGQERHILA